MKQHIKVGYAVPGGQPVTVPVDHTLITGRTQQSGKTTCAEAMAHNVDCPVLTFLTKPDEKGFRDARTIPIYNKERADWEFVVSILEASLRKPSLKKGWIMRLCEAGHFKGAKWPKPKNLAGVLANCETAMGKGGSLELTELRGYLRKVVPTVADLEFSDKLRLGRGINVMDLRAVALPAQFLIMAMALDWVYEHGHHMIVLIPEAQKFFPLKHNTPVKAAGERIIQEKGAAKVFLWLDTQMLRNLDTAMRGQMGVWLFGVQRDTNEAKRTLEHIPEEPDGPPKPTLGQLMQLRRGHFIAAYGATLIPEFYVQPFWVPDVHAQAVAMGEEKVSSAEEIWEERKQEFTAEDAEGEQDGKAKDSHGGFSGSVVRESGCTVETGQPEHIFQNTEGEDAGGAGDGDSDPPCAEEVEPDTCNLKPETFGAETMNAEEKKLAELVELLGMQTVISHLHGLAQQRQGDQGAREEGNGGKEGENQPVAQRAGRTAVASGAPRPLISGSAAEACVGDFEAFYQAIKARAQQEAPAILAMLAQQPELRVKIERPVIPADGVLQPLARLLKDGFFSNGGKRSKDVEKEFSRRGWPEARPTIYKGMIELCRLGFLMREEVGKREYEYHAVPGMKVTTE